MRLDLECLKRHTNPRQTKSRPFDVLSLLKLTVSDNRTSGHRLLLSGQCGDDIELQAR